MHCFMWPISGYNRATPAQEGRMPRSVEMKFRTEPELKAEVQKIFAEIGVSASDALNMFLRRVRYEGGLPPDLVLKIPNAETRAAMLEDFQNKKGYNSFKELLAELDAEDSETDTPHP
jgi:DNA-damage-inducible protein J